MGSVFINYRRDDSGDAARGIYAGLAGAFGDEVIFQDVNTIAYGDDFIASIEKFIASASVMLVVIGPLWLTLKNRHGVRRIDEPLDVVRHEIELGLASGVRIIPVTVQHASMPAAASLPTSIQQIARLNGTVVRPDRDFAPDVEKLVLAITHIINPPHPTGIVHAVATVLEVRIVEFTYG